MQEEGTGKQADEFLGTWHWALLPLSLPQPSLGLWSLVTITFGFSLNLLLSFLNSFLTLPAPRCVGLPPQPASKHPSHIALPLLLSLGSATALSHALVLSCQWVQ